MHLLNNKHAETYKKSAHLSLVAFLSNFPNFILVFITALSSMTAVVWVDTLVSFGETLHSLIVWIVAYKMCKETGDKYNYGMGRLEVFISFICDLIISIGMCAVIGGAVLNILSPEAPNSSLIFFCILKCSNSTFDLIFLIKQAKICRAHPSKLNETEKKAYKDALINDVTVGVIALICYLFRSYSFVKYFSPIVSIILAVYFIFGYVKHMKDSIAEISDVSLPIKKQDEIYDIIMLNHDAVKRIKSINCRKLNGISHIDINLVLKDDITFSEIKNLLDGYRNQINIIEPNAEIELVISPTEI